MGFQYSTLFHSPLSLMAYGILACALLSLWIKRNYIIWGNLLGIAMLCGVVSGRLQWHAVLFIVLFAVLSYFTFHARHLRLKIVCGILVYVLSILLWFHKIPGFYNWKIIDGIFLSKDALPFSLYLNFDKPLIGLFILGFGTLPLLRSKLDCYKMLIKMLPIAAVGICMVIGLAYGFGYAKYEPKWVDFFLIWFLENLFLSTIAEEVLFRGFVQKYLSIAFKNIRFGNGIALLTASVLFGIVHTGDLKYVFFSSVAGILYGRVYMKTNRIEASIATHMLLNSIHILAFTYPALAP